MQDILNWVGNNQGAAFGLGVFLLLVMWCVVGGVVDIVRIITRALSGVPPEVKVSVNTMKPASLSNTATAAHAAATPDPMSDSLRKAVAQRVKEWVDAIPEPDRPLIAAAGVHGKALLTPRQLLHEVQSRTPTGEKIVENWVGLVIRTIKDGPLPQLMATRLDADG